jgi:DNA recombination protein RmuC
MVDFLFLLLIFLIFILGGGILLFFLKREIQNLKEEKKEDLALNLLKQDLQVIRERFEKGYSQIAYQLGQVQELGRSMKDFQDFLKSPTFRGNIGEQILRNLLEQTLPKENFQLQYQLQPGQRVDAIIKIRQGIIPIDAKFPMASFREIAEAKTSSKKRFYLKQFIKNIKKHIDDISEKYILPQRGTVDFALMYIPSEPVYYEIALNQPRLLDYGYQKKVYFVSPNSFYYFLKIIMIGLEGAKIEEASKKILEGLKAIELESINFGKELSILTSHIERAKGASDRVKTKYDRLIGRIDNLRLLKEERKELENKSEQ